ncbi:hypothetical protein KL910_005393, partial [Ogataea haglerorum]
MVLVGNSSASPLLSA